MTPPNSPALRQVASILIIGLICSFTESARLRRSVSANMDQPSPCISQTIMERNKSASVIFTATVKKCDKHGLRTYSCYVEVWSVMKGRRLASDILQVHDNMFMQTSYTKRFTDVHGLGNPSICKSDIKEAETRVFFLNREGDRLELAASLLYITLENLDNTEKVIRGIEIQETPKRPPDPCLFVRCGFGAKCESTENGTATCVCPSIACGEAHGYSNILAPMCGVDGVTYPTECSLKVQQCWYQKRIKIKSRQPCPPSLQHDPCEGIVCGNSALCEVVRGVGKCQCPSCDDAVPNLVCGSDQITYKTECDLRRAACMSAQDIHVMRRAPCEPCIVFNVSSNSLIRVCNGACSLDDMGKPQCCDDIPCASSSNMMICGSDGRTYMSKCALDRYKCKSGKNITVVSAGSCPSGKKSTLIRGSASIVADDKCPGDCRSNSSDFIDFTKTFERAVAENLDMKNKEDIDERVIRDFKIEEVRNGSAVFVYSARITWNDQPIDKDFAPGQDSTWAYQRLHDPDNGVFAIVINSLGVEPAAAHDPIDDFITEEICGSMQCDFSASCKLSKDESGGFLYDCDCSVIGDSNRLSVTLGCKIASNHHFYDNKLSVKQASCATKSFLTMTNLCIDPPNNPCEALDCETGSTCVLTNDVPACECVSCQQEFMPVCGTNGKTYRNQCELERENCLENREKLVTVKKEGMCENQCDDVDCGHGGLCEELPQGSAQCICPENCIEVYAPVCGSDGVTYDNDCKMILASCNKKVEISVLHRSPCVPGLILAMGGMEHSGEGSGDSDCQFGGTYETTLDDEDERCICSMICESSDVMLCGSDGVTYYGECQLNKARCQKQENIIVIKVGKCPKPCSESTFGCCEDGITHAKDSRRAGCPETCQCNEHGSFSPFCNHTNGQCVCRPGITGLRCDECLNGYWNFRAVAEKTTIGCMRCHCEHDGSIRDDCDEMTGQCTCKEGVAGTKCSICENGGTLTQDGCLREGIPRTAASCEELDCQHGKECTEVAIGSLVFECRCPGMSSCNRFSNKKVCASNGITYINECYLKLMSCREGKELVILSEGSCEDYFSSSPPVSPPVIKPETTTPVTSVTTATIPLSTTNGTTMDTTTSVPQPLITSTKTVSVSTETTSHTMTTSTFQVDCRLEGSGEESEMDDTTTDDEDGLYETSGEEPPNADGMSSKGKISTYRVTATLVYADGMELVHSYDVVSSDPEIMAQYKSAILKKVKKIIQKMPNRGGVNVSSLKNVVIKPYKGNGVNAQLEMDISSLYSTIDIEEFVNERLCDGEIVMITTPVENAAPVLEYVEDGSWNIPQFGGSSFIEFNTINAYSSVTIELTFKSNDVEGLLLYDGQMEGPDFISLAIVNGYVEFRFNSGSGVLTLHSSVPVYDGKWHNVLSRRNRREGLLKVDDEQEITGASPSQTTRINLNTPLFVGGCPTVLENMVKRHTSTTKGLTGCIKELKFGEHGSEALDITSSSYQVQNSLRIAECTRSPCMPNPCRYSSNCLIVYQLEEFTFKCDCGPHYFGKVCEHEATKDTCASNPCHESSTCVVQHNSYQCICPPSRNGTNCEMLLIDQPLPTPVDPSYMPMFAGDSYIERPSLEGVSTQLDIEVVFYTYQLEGLIFYNAQSDSGEGDYIALNIRNGYLDFMYDLGQGAVHIVSETKVSLNQWHTAILSRIMRVGDLMLDDNPKVKGESNNDHTQLNLGQSLYIGAVPESITLPKGTSITSGLMGAIQKFVVNESPLPQSLMDEQSTSYHVQAFNGHPCYREPCKNRGSCVPALGNYTCHCMPGYSGPTCDSVEEIEIADDGNIEQDPQVPLYWDGNVRAFYNNHISKKVHSMISNEYEFELKTKATDGLLFYNGKSSDRGDYVALGVVRGLLHFVYDLGSGPSYIVSSNPVNDGTWKSVKIIRKEHEASMQVDDTPLLTVSGSSFSTILNTNGVLWIGGCTHRHLPPRHRGLPKSFYIGYTGCLRRFHIDGEALRLRENVLNRPHFSVCQHR